MNKEIKHKCIFKTKCLNCKTKFDKELFLFDYCPVCKGTNLKEIREDLK